jgi:hypothetical protein
MTPRRWLCWTALFTLVGEGLTLAMRFGGGMTATEFNEHAPFLLQIHHLFWGVPLLAAAWLTRRWKAVAATLAALAVACVASDVLHHFLVLPIVAGNTGWHWP